MEKNEFVILVDELDNETGVMEKMEVHKKAILHRAISVFIVNTKGEWLLQRRAFNKYHSNGLWTNTCCSHPFPGESNIEAAHRRLREEMGLDAVLEKIFQFTYREELDNELTEHEIDHIFVGVTDKKPEINTSEVAEWKYMDFNKLKNELDQLPENYTVWFKKIASRVNQHLNYIL